MKKNPLRRFAYRLVPFHLERADRGTGYRLDAIVTYNALCYLAPAKPNWGNYYHRGMYSRAMRVLVNDEIPF